MKVLLTGGAGYIGSHIAVELLNCGHNVIIADNYSNSSPEIVGKIEKITGNGTEVYELDLADAKKLDKLFRESKPDAVIHLAGFKAVGESVAVPLKYYRNNIDCTLTLLETMEKHGVARLIFSSSATVYGATNLPPYTEDMLHGICTNPYGCTKQMIERIIMDTVGTGWLSAVILRYFNPVGAHSSGLIGESPQGIPNNLMPFIMQVAVGKLPELNVFGSDYPTRDGTGIRDYIHVTDLARGHVGALEYCRDNDGVEVFNLGTGMGCSVLELTDAFERTNGIRIPYKIAPRRAGDLPETYADVSKAEKLMRWKARLTIEDMCRDAYFYAHTARES
ncbi:MAG: UDP-glucose 4-epimerase GalE [Oscillospiraceae bacterium]|nr:UDP-glucose 4-epimerase GalE [Oscillospiraceae bacterium]